MNGDHPNSSEMSSKYEVTDSEIASLKPDFRGLYSVCFHKSRAGTKDIDEITEVFSIAGEVKATYVSERFIFIRYGTKDEAIKSLQLLKDQYGLNVAVVRDSNKKEREDNKEKSKSQQKRQDSKTFKKNDNPKKGQSYLNGFEESYDTDVADNIDRKNNSTRTKSKRPMSKDYTDKNKTMVNGHSGKGGERKTREFFRKNDHTEDAGSSVSTQFELFAYNIESKEIFEKTIMDYNPLAVKFIEKGHKRYAFLSMATEVDAEKCVKGLNKKMQTERQLFVQYNTKYSHIHDDMSIMSEDSCSGGHNESLPVLEKIDEDEMPSLEVDYSDMPPLIEDFNVHDPDGRYDIDCRVCVNHFPFQCLESQLRGAFHRYRVSDICMVNNGEASGCTKAVLYMATIYDALWVVREMDQSTYFGHPIKVYIPSENILLNHVFMRETRR